ncbi:PhnD/SsuA/transferrin family substrate-binding protein [Marinospirillum sp.]|uniref:PhnD/SsuA/transferrin family substrate-binding protein n=1 Tax=Marinospirillum sp. TaxID=2183934 RepID=UPI003A852138
MKWKDGTAQKICLLSLILLMASAWSHAEVYRFAPLPMQAPEQIAREVLPMLAYLEAETGLHFELVYSESYEELIHLFAEGDIDLTYLGPLPYVRLKASFPEAEPLVVFREPQGNALYTCALVHFAGDTLPTDETSLAYALTQPLSTCGFLATAALLRERGVDLHQARYCYLGRHDQVALAVVRGEFALGGLKTQIAEQFSHLGLAVLAETPPLPGFALVANQQRLTPADRLRLQHALLDLNVEANADLLSHWGPSLRYGVELIEDANYAPVRALLQNTPIPEECHR